MNYDPLRVTVPISYNEYCYLLELARERIPMTFTYEDVLYDDMILISLIASHAVFQEAVRPMNVRDAK